MSPKRAPFRLTVNRELEAYWTRLAERFIAREEDPDKIVAAIERKTRRILFPRSVVTDLLEETERHRRRKDEAILRWGFIIWLIAMAVVFYYMPHTSK